MSQSWSAHESFTWRGHRYRPNDLFRIRVLGEFPLGASDTLIALRWVEQAQARQLPLEGYRRIAVDVAQFGDDYTVIDANLGRRILSAVWGTDLGMLRYTWRSGLA